MYTRFPSLINLKAAVTGPSLPTTGLVLNLDAENASSYPGTGSTWTDISGNGKHCSLNGGFSFISASPKAISFNGSNGYGGIPTLNLQLGQYSVVLASRANVSGASGRLVGGWNNDFALGHWNGGTESYYAGAWVRQSLTPQDTNWRIYVATGNTTTDTYQLFVNNSLVVSNSLGSEGVNGFSIGGASGEYCNGRIGFLMAYNRVLTVQEIADIYNAKKTLYGLV